MNILKFNEHNSLETINEFFLFNKHKNEDKLKELEKRYQEELGKRGELGTYLKYKGENFTFGILRKLFIDALAYKNKRELTKGSLKFLHRTIPMIGSLIWFPVSLISFCFGMSRALHKILIPIVENPNKTYNSFLNKFIDNIMNISEGEYKMLMQDDWFYNLFVMDDDLVQMVRKEHLIVFASYLAGKMESEPDEKVVPNHYIENEFKLWLNKEFKISPPMDTKKPKI